MTNAKSITICGSMAFMPQMRALANELKTMGYAVDLPDDTETDYQAMDESAQVVLKRRFIDDHLAKIKRSDAVLIANYEKHGIAGYVGANTLMEIAFAYVLDKQIFLLNKPDEQGCQLEVLGLMPIVLDGAVANLQMAS